MEIHLCTTKVMCILMSKSLLEWAIVIFFGYRGRGACFTQVPQCDSVVTHLRQFACRVTKIKLQCQGSNIMFDDFRWLTNLWFPWPMLPASMMIQRCTQEHLAEVTGNEPLAVCCDMWFSNSDESSSPSAQLCWLQHEINFWQDQGWTVQPGKAVMRAGRSQLGRPQAAGNKLFYSLKLTATLPQCFDAYCVWTSAVPDHAARFIWNYLRSQEEGDIRPHRLILRKKTRDFCCLASQSSDTCTMQKKHFHYKLTQSAENIKASAILSYLKSFHPQHIYGSRTRGRVWGRGIS